MDHHSRKPGKVFDHLYCKQMLLDIQSKPHWCSFETVLHVLSLEPGRTAQYLPLPFHSSGRCREQWGVIVLCENQESHMTHRISAKHVSGPVCHNHCTKNHQGKKVIIIYEMGWFKTGHFGFWLFVLFCFKALSKSLQIHEVYESNDPLTLI